VAERVRPDHAQARETPARVLRPATRTRPGRVARHPLPPPDRRGRIVHHRDRGARGWAEPRSCRARDALATRARVLIYCSSFKVCPTHYRASRRSGRAHAYIKLMRAADSVTARLDPLSAPPDLTSSSSARWRRCSPVDRSATGTWAGSSSAARQHHGGVGNLARRGLVRLHRVVQIGGSSRSRSPTRPPADRRELSSPRAGTSCASLWRLLARGAGWLAGFCRQLGLARVERAGKGGAMAPNRTRFGSLAHY